MYRYSQLIASTHASLSLGERAQTIVIGFERKGNIDEALGKLDTGSLSLHFEGLKSNDQLPVIDVYLNLEEERRADEKHYLDSMGLYGLPDSTAASHGQDLVFDAGALLQQLRRRQNWSEESLRITLIPSRPSRATLTIDRITLYFHRW